MQISATGTLSPPDVFDDLPEPEQFASPVLAPKRPWWKFRGRGASVQPKERDRVDATKWIVFGLFALGLAAGSSMYLLRDRISVEKLKPVLPGHDSPEKLLQDFAGSTNKILAALDSVKTAEQRDQLLPVVSRMIEARHLVTPRAVKVGPIDDASVELGQEIYDVIERGKAVEERADRLLEKRVLVSGKLALRMQALKNSNREALAGLALALTKTPKPEDLENTFGYELTGIRERLWRSVVSVNSEQGFRELAAVFDRSAINLEQLLSRNTSNPARYVEPRYRKRNSDISLSLEQRLERLKQTYGVFPVQTPVERYEIAEKKLMEVLDSMPTLVTENAHPS